MLVVSSRVSRGFNNETTKILPKFYLTGGNSYFNLLLSFHALLKTLSVIGRVSGNLNEGGDGGSPFRRPHAIRFLDLHLNTKLLKPPLRANQKFCPHFPLPSEGMQRNFTHRTSLFFIVLSTLFLLSSGGTLNICKKTEFSKVEVRSGKIRIYKFSGATSGGS